MWEKQDKQVLKDIATLLTNTQEELFNEMDRQIEKLEDKDGSFTEAIEAAVRTEQMNILYKDFDKTLNKITSQKDEIEKLMKKFSEKHNGQ